MSVDQLAVLDEENTAFLKRFPELMDYVPALRKTYEAHPLLAEERPFTPKRAYEHIFTEGCHGCLWNYRAEAAAITKTIPEE